MTKPAAQGNLPSRSSLAAASESAVYSDVKTGPQAPAPLVPLFKLVVNPLLKLLGRYEETEEYRDVECSSPSGDQNAGAGSYYAGYSVPNVPGAFPEGRRRCSMQPPALSERPSPKTSGKPSQKKLNEQYEFCLEQMESLKFQCLMTSYKVECIEELERAKKFHASEERQREIRAQSEYAARFHNPSVEERRTSRMKKKWDRLGYTVKRSKYPLGPKLVGPPSKKRLHRKERIEASRMREGRIHPHGAQGSVEDHSRDHEKVDRMAKFEAGGAAEGSLVRWYPQHDNRCNDVLSEDPALYLFKRYAELWASFESFSPAMKMEALHSYSFPWPLLETPTSVECITKFAVEEFVLHPTRLRLHTSSLRISVMHQNTKDIPIVRRAILKEELMRWHSDRFNARVLPRVSEDDREFVRSGAEVITKALLALIEG